MKASPLFLFVSVPRTEGFNIAFSLKSTVLNYFKWPDSNLEHIIKKFPFKGKEQKVLQIAAATQMLYVTQKMAFIIVAISYKEEVSFPL